MVFCVVVGSRFLLKVHVKNWFFDEMKYFIKKEIMCHDTNFKYIWVLGFGMGYFFNILIFFSV